MENSIGRAGNRAMFLIFLFHSQVKARAEQESPASCLCSLQLIPYVAEQPDKMQIWSAGSCGTRTELPICRVLFCCFVGFAPQPQPCPTAMVEWMPLFLTLCPPNLTGALVLTLLQHILSSMRKSHWFIRTHWTLSAFAQPFTPWPPLEHLYFSSSDLKAIYAQLD